MEVEVDKMAQMVAELLELSRVESGQLPLRLSPTTLQSIVNPAVERLATQAERAGLALAVELPAGLPNVVVDSERTQQVMINLIHNAIKFTPSGGVITIRAEREAERPGMLVVCVRDTGVGIPAANLPRIFERAKAPVSTSLCLSRYVMARSRQPPQNPLRLQIDRQLVLIVNGLGVTQLSHLLERNRCA
jgi:K+-sensing histidine kinase KdpD